MTRKIISGAASSLIFIASTIVTAMIQLHYVVRFLPKELAGVWILFLTVGAYVAFFDLGISPTLGREIAFARGNREIDEATRQNRIADILASCGYLYRWIAAGAAILCIGCGNLYILHVFPDPKARVVALAWTIFSIGAAFNLLGSTAFAGLFGFGDIAVEKLLRSASLWMGLILTVILLYAGFGIVGPAIGWALQGLLARVIARRVLQKRYLGPDYPAGVVRTEVLRQIAGPSLKLATIQLGAILILQSANPLIAIVIGAASIPLYEPIARIAAATMTLALLVVSASSPFISSAFAAKDMPTVQKLLFRNLRYGMAITVVACTVLGITCSKIVEAWLGRGFYAGSAVAWILLIMVSLEVHHVIFATIMMASGQIVFVKPALIAAAINLILAVILAQKFGLLGVAMAVLIAQLFTNNWYAPYRTIQYLGVSWTEILKKVWVPVLILTAWQLAVLSVIVTLLGNSLAALPWLLIVLPAGVISGAVAASMLLMEANERRTLWEMLRDLRGTQKRFLAAQ